MTLTKTLAPTGTLVAINGNDLAQPQVLEDMVDELTGLTSRVFPVSVDVSTAAETRSAIAAAALAASLAGGGVVKLPGRTAPYVIDRDGANNWCIDWLYDNVGIIGDYGTTVVQAAAGMPDTPIAMFRFDERKNILLQDIIIDGNWGNQITEIAEGSHGAALPQATIYLEETTYLPSSGTLTLALEGNNYVYITYTGKTAGSVTGCSVVGTGSGTMARHDAVVWTNSAAGINHTTQTDPKNYQTMWRGCSRVLINRCTFRQGYGDGVWLGCPSNDDLFVPSKDIRITNCEFNTLARNGISFGAIVERITIDNNTIKNVWTCPIDGEPQGFDGWNRDVWIHHNVIMPWPVFPGGGQGQAISCTSGFPGGYNHASASRGWRINDNLLYGWTALVNAIDVEVRSNRIFLQGTFIGDVTVSSVNTGTDTITAVAHGQKTGDGPLWIRTDNTLPAGITASGGNPLRSIDLWMIRVDADNFKVATSLANAVAGIAVDITSAGTGTHTLTGPRTVSPVFISHACDDIRVLSNHIYANGKKTIASGESNNGAITVAFYGSANTNLQPAGILIADNVIKAHNGVHGIWVNGQGGFSTGDGTAVVAPASGTATSVSRNTLVKTGAGWTVNQWIGWQVIADGKVAVVESNTSDTLTLKTPDLPIGSAIAWRQPTGEWTTAPTGTPTYVITSNSGWLTIRNNTIDCGAYGSHVAGGHGLYLFNDRAGARIEVQDNKFKNPTSWGVFVVGATVKPALYLELRDNKFWDDQAVVTGSAAIRFNDAQSLTSIVKTVMSGNSLSGGITTLLSNVAAGTWLVSDGESPRFAGYGTPESVVAAPVGATYMRLDGGASTTLYVKTSGTGNTGWTAK